MTLKEMARDFKKGYERRARAVDFLTDMPDYSRIGGPNNYDKWGNRMMRQIFRYSDIKDPAYMLSSGLTYNTFLDTLLLAGRNFIGKDIEPSTSYDRGARVYGILHPLKVRKAVQIGEEMVFMDIDEDGKFWEAEERRRELEQV